MAAMFLLSVVGTAVFIAAYSSRRWTRTFRRGGSPKPCGGRTRSRVSACHRGRRSAPPPCTGRRPSCPTRRVESAMTSAARRDPKVAAEMITGGLSETGIGRRPVMVTAMVAAIAALPIAVLAPLDPGRCRATSSTTPSGATTRASDSRATDGTPIKLSDVAMVRSSTSCPRPTHETPPSRGAAKAAAVIVRIDSEGQERRVHGDGGRGRARLLEDLTHGCPVALLEQQTHHMLCRHQSTFDVTDGAKVIFGPAHRPLPQLPTRSTPRAIRGPRRLHRADRSQLLNIHKDK